MSRTGTSWCRATSTCVSIRIRRAVSRFRAFRWDSVPDGARFHSKQSVRGQAAPLAASTDAAARAAHSQLFRDRLRPPRSFAKNRSQASLLQLFRGRQHRHSGRTRYGSSRSFAKIRIVTQVVCSRQSFAAHGTFWRVSMSIEQKNNPGSQTEKQQSSLDTQAAQTSPTTTKSPPPQMGHFVALAAASAALDERSGRCVPREPSSSYGGRRTRDLHQRGRQGVGDSRKGASFRLRGYDDAPKCSGAGQQVRAA